MDERMKILIAYDGSESSDAALDLRRAGLPKRADTLVLSVADVFLPPPIKETDDIFPLQIPAGVRRAHERAARVLEEAKSLANRASERIRERFPEWSVDYEAVADSPTWAVVRKADRWKPDLVITGSHGHSAFGGRFILGSVSQRILYEATCSVHVARRHRDENNSPIRIMVGVDGSPQSNAALDVVSRREWPKQTEVHVVTVVDTVIPVADPSEPSKLKWIEVDDANDWYRVRQVFEPSADKLRAGGLHTSLIIKRGDPKDKLIEEADSWGADCIFVGAKGMRGIERILLGSVSAAVAARARCSVEVVRP
jgi:nucleotide-binding universal stress UspA family protein